MKFFRRKLKPTELQDLRSFYRHLPDKKHAVGAKVRFADGRSAVIRLLDLSAGGAGISFSPERDPELEIGSELTISFSSLRSRTEVRAAAKVANRLSEGGEHRYGVAFTDLAGLFAELDQFWFQSFNRRHLPRALPALDARVALELSGAGRAFGSVLHDISTEGLSAVTAADSAELLQVGAALAGQLTLKRGGPAIELSLQVLHSREVSNKLHFGASMLWPEDSQESPERQLIDEYCKKRLEEVARWNRASQ